MKRLRSMAGATMRSSPSAPRSATAILKASRGTGTSITLTKSWVASRKYCSMILASTPLNSSERFGSEPGSLSNCLRPSGDSLVKTMNLAIAAALRRGRLPDRVPERLDAHRRVGADLDRPSRAELDRDAGDDLIARRLDDVDEVVRAEDGVLGRDPPAHRLDLLVDLRQSLRSLLERLPPLVGEPAEQDVRCHRYPRSDVPAL